MLPLVVESTNVNLDPGRTTERDGRAFGALWMVGNAAQELGPGLRIETWGTRHIAIRSGLRAPEGRMTGWR